MAHHWYIRRGDKLYGPLTSAQLKKLAGEGKISPQTEIRLGDDGKWTHAARVQGLFTASPGETGSVTLSASSMPPVVPPPVATPSTTLPPVVTAQRATGALPGTPPVARPVTATPFVSGAAPPLDSAPLAGKLIGAVGLTFGFLTLGTCWLSILNLTFGWIGIAVGAMGLLVGIAGLVVAALQNASGLVLNVAAAGSSLIGLVVSVVLAIQSGLFTRPEPLVVAATPISTPPPAAVAAPVEAPASDLEPVPEPVWTAASQPIELPPVRATIHGAAVEQIRLESGNPLSMQREKPAPFLHVRVLIENISTDKLVNAPGWLGGGGHSGALAAVSDAIIGTDVGKQLAGATASATLVDDKQNSYPQIEAIRLPASHAELASNSPLRPGESRELHLLFDRPVDAAEYLRLELAPAGFGGSEPLRFQIPKEMWSGMPPADDAEDKSVAS